jgi:hypothetical protein
MRTFYALALTAALAVPAFAQPPGGGRGRGMGGMQAGPAFLLGSEDIQKDINFSAEQKEKFTKFQAEQREARQGLQGADQDERQKKMAEMQEKSTAFFKDLLTEDQNKRLKQIGLQNDLKTNPARAFTNEEHATALKLTDDQKAKIKEITDQLQKDRRELMQAGNQGGGGGGNGGRRGMQLSPEQQKKMDALSKESSDKIMEILTADQKKSLEDMKGKPFEGKMPTLGGGRRGGGGAGGN